MKMKMIQTGWMVGMTLTTFLPVQAGLLFSPEVTVFDRTQPPAGSAMPITISSSDPNPTENLGENGTNFVFFSNPVVHAGTVPVDVEFSVTDPDSAAGPDFTEYVINGISVNASPAIWHEFQMQLGWISTATGQFVSASSSSTGLDFDAPNFDSPVPTGPVFGPFPGLPPSVRSSDVLAWRGLIHPNPLGNLFWSVAVHLPDSTAIPNVPVTESGYSFRLRLVPVAVPEPSTGLLVAVCLGLTWSPWFRL